MIDDRFIFDAHLIDKKQRMGFKQPTVKKVDFALQEYPSMQDSWIQNDLGSRELEERD